jgi:hypothetical protein
MSAEIIVILALILFFGAILWAGWLVLKTCLNRILDDRFAQHQQYTTLICTHQIERTQEVRNGYHVNIERRYELAQPNDLPRQLTRQIPRIESL